MIQTDRLILREPRLEDAEALMAVFADSLAMRYIGNGAPRSIDQVRASLAKRTAHLNNTGYTLWTVESAADRADDWPFDPGEILGDCGVIPAAWTGPDSELAYRFKPTVWGRGVATEAAAAAMQDIADRTELNEVWGLTDLRNAASRRVLEKAGFAPAGKTDKYYDELCALHLWHRGPQLQ